MAMSRAKVTIVFTSGGAGWTEQYYLPATTVDIAIINSQALLKARNNLRASNVQMNLLRVQDADEPRVSRLTNLSPQPGGTYTSTCDDVKICAMMRLFTAVDGTSRPLFIRGVPTEAAEVAKGTNDSVVFQSQFKQLGEELAQGVNGSGQQYLVKYRPKPDLVGFTNTNDITAWVPDSTNSKLTTLTLANPVTVNANSYVDIYKVVGLPFPPGQCRVAKSVVSSTTLSIYYRTPSDYKYPGNGFLVEYASNFTNINDFDQVPRWTARATGRPFDQSRGRRRGVSR